MRFYSRPFLAFLPAALGLAAASFSAPAMASGGYPGEIKSKLEIAGDAPPCTICHRDLAGGSGTVIQAFGVAMVANGLTGGSAIDKLDAALDKAEADNSDSDGDGQSDIDELKAGTNPSQAGGGAAVPAKYGCIEQNGSIAGSTSAPPRLASLAMAGLVAGFLFLRRRR